MNHNTCFQGDVDVLEPGYGLSIEKSVSLLQRVLNLADITMITSNLALYDLEQEKNMTPGTMLRQCLRIGRQYTGRSHCVSEMRQDIGTTYRCRLLSWVLHTMSFIGWMCWSDIEVFCQFLTHSLFYKRFCDAGALFDIRGR